ncbi:MAG: hypothetical protein LBC75_12135 [Fibromonadaceae bacterium]|jgi:uncharacterized protein (TIGR02145 family)|nr:hypothetical protein [Fibromonadaceae bacterium]
MRTIIKAIALLITLNIAIFAQEKGSFKDPRDGKTYKTVKIGNQVWMAENLNYDTMNNNDFTSGKTCNENTANWVGNCTKGNLMFRSICYKGDESNCRKYGRLYKWFTAKAVCPKGWRLPNADEWQALVDFAGGDKVAGKKLKASSGWYNDYTKKSGNGEDKFGFSALPGGMCSDLGVRDCGNVLGIHGYWWSDITDSDRHTYSWRITGLEEAYNTIDGVWKEDGLGFNSVRCVQGDAEEIFKAKVAKAKAETEAYVKANGGTFTDTRDKKTYKTIKINGQVWMAENLNYATENSKCHNDSTAYCDKYGRLYDGETAMKSCPAGWHLPNNAEWERLFNSADGPIGLRSSGERNTAGKFLKAADGWADGMSSKGTDKFGFSALPNTGGRYEGNWWGNTGDNDKASRIIINSGTNEARSNSIDKKSENYSKIYYSIRCIQDGSATQPTVQPAPQPTPKPAEPPKQAEQPKPADPPKKADPPKQQSSKEYCNLTFPKKTCVEMSKSACKIAGGKTVDKCK